MPNQLSYYPKPIIDKRMRQIAEDYGLSVSALHCAIAKFIINLDDQGVTVFAAGKKIPQIVETVLKEDK